MSIGTGEELHQWDGETDVEGFGYSIKPAGDVNCDGQGDVIITAVDEFYYEDPNPNRVYVYSGGDYAQLQMIEGLATNDGIGVGVASAGDINLDGCSDLLIGVSKSSETDSYSGHAEVISGLDGSKLLSLTHDTELALLGYAVTAVTDCSDDGKSNLSDPLV